MNRAVLAMILLLAFCLPGCAPSTPLQSDEAPAIRRNKTCKVAKMNVAIGSAFYGAGDLKKALIARLKEMGHTVSDFTPDGQKDKLHYPEIAHKVAAEVSNGNCDRGILICGTGMGMSIVANKHPRVYAALVENEYAARYSRIFNNSNVLCFGQFVTAREKATDILDVWMGTDFADHPKWGKYCREIALPQVVRIEGEVFRRSGKPGRGGNGKAGKSNKPGEFAE